MFSFFLCWTSELSKHLCAARNATMSPCWQLLRASQSSQHSIPINREPRVTENRRSLFTEVTYVIIAEIKYEYRQGLSRQLVAEPRQSNDACLPCRVVPNGFEAPQSTIVQENSRSTNVRTQAYMVRTIKNSIYIYRQISTDIGLRSSVIQRYSDPKLKPIIVAWVFQGEKNMVPLPVAAPVRVQNTTRFIGYKLLASRVRQSVQL